MNNLIICAIRKYTNRIIIVFFLLVCLTVINVLQPIITRTLIDDGLYTNNVKIVVICSVEILLLNLIRFLLGWIKEGNSIFYNKYITKNRRHDKFIIYGKRRK